MCQYLHYSQPRIAFWHSGSELLVAWQPSTGTKRSIVKSVFQVRRGIEYLATQDGAAMLRQLGER